MIQLWLMSKLGKVGYSILKYVAIILLCASPFIYHFWTVGNLKDSLHDSQEKVTELAQNVQKLDEITEKNTKVLGFMQENQKFLQDLEKENEQKNKQKDAERAAFEDTTKRQELLLGDKEISPLLADALNRLDGYQESADVK